MAPTKGFVAEPLLSELDLAQRTKTSPKMWQNRRLRGDGPPYRKVGHLVRYSWPDVEAWMDAQQKERA